MNTWSKYKLSDIADIIAGYAFKSSEFGRVGEAVVKIKDINPPHIDIPNTDKVDMGVYPTRKMDKYKICSGDYVIAMTGATIGKVGRMRHEGVAYINQRVAKIKAKQGIDNDFVYYAICGDSFQQFIRNNIDSNSAQENISTTSIGKFPITLPPLAEQKRIAAILGALDDKIELNRRINANLEEQAKALYKSWFVDFEPFKDGNFVDSELGPIPAGWEIGMVNNVVRILSGFAFKSETFVPSGQYQLITIKGVQDGYLDINGASYISEIPLKMPAYCNLKTGDILLSLTGNVGRVCIVDRPNLLLNQRVAKLQPQRSKQDALFVYMLFRQDTFKNHLMQIARGTAQLNLSPVETGEIKIILPPTNILIQFSQIGEYLFDKIVLCHQEMLYLSALRDTLLPKLMNEEIGM